VREAEGPLKLRIKGTRFLLLRNPENLTQEPLPKLQEALRLNVLLRQACAGPKNPLASRARCLRGGAAWWPARPIQSGSAGFGSREGLLVIPREPPGRMLPRFLGMALQGVEIVQGVASTEPAGVD